MNILPRDPEAQPYTTENMYKKTRNKAISPNDIVQTKEILKRFMPQELLNQFISKVLKEPNN